MYKRQALQPAAQSIRLPDIGDPSQVYFGPDEEQKMGLEVMQWLRARGAVMDDVQLNEYLNSIGQSIVTYADQMCIRDSHHRRAEPRCSHRRTGEYGWLRHRTKRSVA